MRGRLEARRLLHCNTVHRTRTVLLFRTAVSLKLGEIKDKIAASLFPHCSAPAAKTTSRSVASVYISDPKLPESPNTGIKIIPCMSNHSLMLTDQLAHVDPLLLLRAAFYVLVGHQCTDYITKTRLQMMRANFETGIARRQSPRPSL